MRFEKWKKIHRQTRLGKHKRYNKPMCHVLHLNKDVRIINEISIIRCILSQQHINRRDAK